MYMTLVAVGQGVTWLTPLSTSAHNTDNSTLTRGFIFT